MLIVFHLSFMSAAAICLIAGVVVAMFFRKNKNWLKMHKAINLTGSCIVLAGALMAFASVELGGSEHAAGLHQQVGLASIVLVSIAVFLGLYSFKAADKAAVRTAHRWAGRASIIGMIATLTLGLRMIGIL